MKNLLAFALFLSSFPLLAQQADYPLETVLQKGHLKYVTCAAFSPDGEYVATGSLDYSIKIWDAGNGKEIRTLTAHTAKIRSVVFSPDGTRILSASSDNTAKEFDVLTGEVIHDYAMTRDFMWQASYNADGSRVLTANDRDLNVVWDAATGEMLGEYERPYGSIIYPEYFNPDGTRLLAADDYKSSKIIGLAAGKDVAELVFDKTQTMSYSPDGKYIALGSTKLFLEVFDGSSGKLLFHLEADAEVPCDGCNTQVRFSNNSKYLLTGAKKDGVILWDPSNGKLLRKYMDCDDRVDYLAFSPNDQYVVVGIGAEIYVFDRSSGTEKLHIENSLYDDYAAVFSSDGKYLVAPDENNTAVLWSVSSGRKAQEFSGYLNHEQDDGMEFSYSDWTDAGILRYISGKAGISVSPDNKYLVKGNIDSSIVMINLETGKIEQKFMGHSKSVWAFDFTDDGTKLVTAGGDNYIKIWDVETGKELGTLRGHRDLIFDVSLSISNQYLVSGSWDGTIRVWDMETMQQTQLINTGNSAPYTVRFASGDLYILSGSLANKFQLWEVDSGELVRSMIGHTDVVAGIDMEFDYGQQLVSGSWDGTVKMWDFFSGMMYNKYSHYAGTVNAVAQHPHGGFIASGGSDQDIYLWSIENKGIVDVLEGHKSPITALQFTFDDNLISCSSDGMVKVWEFDPGTNSYTELYTYIQLDKENWLARNEAGYFDGTAKALEYVNYVSGMDVIAIGSLFEQYYTPGLIKRIMEGEQFEDTGENINDMMHDTPEVEISVADAQWRGEEGVVEWREESISINITVTEGSKPEEIRVYNNGKLILSESWSTKVEFRGGGNAKTCDVMLTDGVNEISAVVVSEDRTESSPVSLEVMFDGEAGLTDLYILAIGINDYQNATYDLSYAVDDAKSFIKTIQEGADTLFHSIHEYLVKDKNAIKSEIEDALEQIASEIGPEDVFVFYYAGHGVMSLEDKDGHSDFYIVTHDVTNLYGDTELLAEKAISATELLEISKKISAEKQLFVLDACHSGGALESLAVRGGVREKALAQLAHSTGTYFLTAAQDFQFANESGGLGHGLFTYAIIEALEGQADGGNNDQKITVNELKSYVEDRVPELSELYQGSAQYPTSYSFGQDFPLVIKME